MVQLPELRVEGRTGMAVEANRSSSQVGRVSVLTGRAFRLQASGMRVVQTSGFRDEG